MRQRYTHLAEWIAIRLNRASESREDEARSMQRFLVVAAVLTLLAPLGAVAQSAFDSSFDHFTTGFRLDGAHLTVDCETCHVAGVFRGTPMECRGCHMLGGRIQASAKPANHVLSTDVCDDCHRTTSWVPLARMNHDAIYGSCSSCHNNVFSQGKPPNHPVTQSECDACHRTIAWLPAGFDHTGVTGNCVSCHDGADATGKNAGHILTTNVCEDCHTTVAFAPVRRVDHTQVLGACSSCHNNVTATGKPQDHIPSSDSCSDCHTTVAWTPARS